MLELTVGAVRALCLGHRWKIHHYNYSPFHARSETQCSEGTLRQLHYYGLIEPVEEDHMEMYQLSKEGMQFLYQFWKYISVLPHEDQPEIFAIIGCRKDEDKLPPEDRYRHKFEGKTIGFTKRIEDNALKGDKVVIIQDENLDLYLVNIEDCRIYKFDFTKCPVDKWMGLIDKMIL